MNATEGSRYPLAGEVVDGKYRIDRMLGEGGMGAVAGAFHLLRKAPVALKFISPDIVRVPGAVDRFVNEAVAASQIDSDHVVRIFDVGQLPTGLPYIVMEMMQGCDLSELLEREGKGGGLPVGRSVHFVVQILRALQVAHAAGIIHRDLKPSNAFVIVKDGEPDFVKLLDFGISKITQDAGESQQHLTQTNTGLGTPLYMSPEQARNARDCTVRSDYYSVAAILYELLTGRTPYQAASPNDLLFKLFTAEPDHIKSVRPDLPDSLAAIIHRGLSKNPDERPASAAEFAELLAPFAEARSQTMLARLSASGAGRPSSVGAPAATERMSHSATPMQLDATIVAAQTSGSPGRTGGTQLGMAASGAGQSSTVVSDPKKGNGKVIAGVAAVALVALVGVGFALKGRGSDATSSIKAPADVPTKPADTASADSSIVTPVKSANPVVAPVDSASAAASAPPAPSASASGAKKVGAGPVVGPTPKDPGSKKRNGFGVGIVE
jgi:serine/threonine-protein kinase